MPHKAAGAQYVFPGYFYSTPNSPENSVTSDFEFVFRMAPKKWDFSNSPYTDLILIQQPEPVADITNGYKTPFSAVLQNAYGGGTFPNTSVVNIGLNPEFEPPNGAQVQLPALADRQKAWIRVRVELNPVTIRGDYSTVDSATPPTTWTPLPASPVINENLDPLESSPGPLSFGGAQQTIEQFVGLGYSIEVFQFMNDVNLTYLALFDGLVENGGVEVAKLDLTAEADPYSLLTAPNTPGQADWTRGSFER